MSDRYDSGGRKILATDWDAIRNVPALVLELGLASPPGSGMWIVEYDGDTDTFTFTSSSSLTVDASDVDYTSTGSQWTATDVETALHDLEAAVDVLQETTLETSGSFTCTWPTGFSSPPANTTIFYVQFGPFVCLTVHATATGTGDGTGGFIMGSVPSALRPAHEKAVIVQGVLFGGTGSVGTAKVKTDGTIEFSFLNKSGSDNFILQTGGATTGVTIGLNSLAAIIYTTD